MNPLLFFGSITVVYLLIYVFKRFFKRCVLYESYGAYFKNTGFSIDLFRLRWHTTALNRALNRFMFRAGKLEAVLNTSFTIGVVVSFLLLPLGIILLFITIFDGNNNNGGIDKSSGDRSSDSVKIEILLPGVNLPLDEVAYYLSALLLSTVVHEFGHALAAIIEDIPVTGFGLQLYYCIPMAYTEISGDHLNALKWFRKLRILCAGIWHNFIFAAFCYLLLSTVHTLVAPFYELNKGVIITDISTNSPLRAKERGLYEGNVITHINDCGVHNDATWINCLFKALRAKAGYCVTSDFIRLNDESIEISHHGPDGSLRCCDEKNEKLCCFEYVDDFNNDDVEIPQHVCLHVRRTLENASGYCTAGRCNTDGYCLRPLLKNTTTIITIKRTKSDYSSLVDVIYIGNPIRDIARTVSVSGFIPKQNFLPPKWADSYVLFLKYNIVFSFGLALVNAIPCLGFDGHHIVSTIINGFLVNRITERPKRDVIALIIAGVGTLLFALAVFKVLLISMTRYFF